ncbi:MAG: hypothetical protein U0174_25670 [Polyangiaceae bacterium]
MKSHTQSKSELAIVVRRIRSSVRSAVSTGKSNCSVNTIIEFCATAESCVIAAPKRPTA